MPERCRAGAPPSRNTRNVAGYLEVTPAPRLAAHNTGINGVIDPAVTAIEVDLLRPAGSMDLSIRLVLYGPGTRNRWTTTAAASVLGDGVWRRYSFSVLEADLTRVRGPGSYAGLVNNLNRISFRHDAGGPSASGTIGVFGTFGMDNIVAIPEPTTAMLLLVGLGVLALRRSR